MKAQAVIFGGVVLLLAAMLVLRDCKWTGEPVITVQTDTVFVRDTHTTVQYVPQVYTYHTNSTVYKTDSLVEYEVIPQPADTASILADYFATRYYIDTQEVQYGKVVIRDSVSTNRIVNRSLFTDFKLPVVTHTITESRNQLYAGVATGFTSQPFVGPAFTFRTRRNLMFDGAVLVGADGKLLYQGGVKSLLSFKR